LPKTKLGEAIAYALNRWNALQVYIDYPFVEVSNNGSERSIKPVVLSQMNSLFASSDSGAKAIAVHLSFIATAKRNGISPVDWYANVLARINGLRTSQLQQLLPQNWSPPMGA
jgi:transposase